MHMRDELRVDNSFQCPHCGTAIPNGADDMTPESARVLHLLHHVRRDALGFDDYGEGDHYIADHCDVDSATTWPRAADQLRVCVDGPIGDDLEAMCRFAIALMEQDKLGRRPANWGDERESLSRTKNRMRRWLDDHYPRPA